MKNRFRYQKATIQQQYLVYASCVMASLNRKWIGIHTQTPNERQFSQHFKMQYKKKKKKCKMKRNKWLHVFIQKAILTFRSSSIYHLNLLLNWWIKYSRKFQTNKTIMKPDDPLNIEHRWYKAKYIQICTGMRGKIGEYDKRNWEWTMWCDFDTIKIPFENGTNDDDDDLLP